MPAPGRLAFVGIALALLQTGCTAHAPVAANPCPAWVDYPADLHGNDGSPYLGCTNQTNLEQMLEDKHDLVAGRKLAPANGEREAKAVKDYEEGKTKTSTGSGGASNATILLQGNNASGTTAQ